MSVAMISVAPDVLSRLLALRLFEDEALDEVLRRTLTNTTKPSVRPIGISGSRSSSAGPSPLVYQLLGETDVASDANEAMVKIVAHLAQYDDDFLPYPYPVGAGCATVTGSRRMRWAPPVRAPVVSCS